MSATNMRGNATETSAPAGALKPGMLNGVRVIEIADELGEYCGLLLAGLGAEVIKIEAPEGNSTRNIGPFVGDKADPERSLHFWAYNRAKKSVVLDLTDRDDVTKLEGLLSAADVLLDSSGDGLLRAIGCTEEELRTQFPALIHARMSPFGDAGPWKDYKANDLIHLALGGIMMNCGYDGDDGAYDTPPIAPQAWHAYHIAGEQMAIGIVASLLSRFRSGQGQTLSCAVHDAVSKNTELDVMYWVMRRAPMWRQTCRHAAERPDTVRSITQSRDGSWFLTWITARKDHEATIAFLAKYGFTEGVREAMPLAVKGGRAIPGTSGKDPRAEALGRILAAFTASFDAKDMPWQEAQDIGLLWAPLRKPHENADDEHWISRGTLQDVEHPELGRSFRYVTSKWLSTATSWQPGRRAPLLGEDTSPILASLPSAKQRRVEPQPRAEAPRLSAHGTPFPLQNVRILDFSWFLASAGGTRLLASLGAESLKVEWKANPDTRVAAMAPVGGRAARESATEPLPGVTDPDMGGQFNNKNSGKRGLSLNIKHPKGLEIAKALVSMSDVVAEGFSPGVLDRLGLGYDVMKSIKPDIIYVQQSGMGTQGKYGRIRTVGPVAAALAGTSEMSGLSSPAMPAGWGYSFLDWMGAYSFALATLGALYHREQTGEGQWIDSSQCESGIFLTGTAMLDWAANGRTFERSGNRSQFLPAAPHGAYRCAGRDRWVAIACHTDHEFRSLAEVSGRTEWLNDPRFASLEARLANQDALDAAVTTWTTSCEAYDVMHALQAAGVAAGVCQTAEDRVDLDPQLAAINWLTEVKGTKIGEWPVIEFPAKMSATPPHAGGLLNRGAPCYGEDNVYVLKDLLGYSDSEIQRFVEDEII